MPRSAQTRRNGGRLLASPFLLPRFFRFLCPTSVNSDYRREANERIHASTRQLAVKLRDALLEGHALPYKGRARGYGIPNARSDCSRKPLTMKPCQSADG